MGTTSPSAKNAWIQESSFVIDSVQPGVNREVERAVRHYLSVILALQLRFFAVWPGEGFYVVIILLMTQPCKNDRVWHSIK